MEARWVRPLAGVPKPLEDALVDPHPLDVGRVLGLLAELGDAAAAVDLHDPELVGLLGPDGRHGDADLGARGDVEVDELPVVHPVEVVAGEDEDERPGVLDEVEVLADGVGRALVPVPVLQGLLGREQGDVVAVEAVEAVGREDVAVQGFAGELGQDEDAADVRVDAVGDGDVDEPEPAGDGHGRLAADLGQRDRAGCPGPRP